MSIIKYTKNNFLAVIPIFILLMFITQSCDSSLEEKPIYSRCSQANRVQFYNVNEAVKYKTPGYFIKEAYAIKSNDYKNAWFVAAKIYGPSYENGSKPGVWIMIGKPEDPYFMGAVNDIAQQFTLYPDTSKGAIGATMDKDGAREVEKCASDNALEPAIAQTQTAQSSIITKREESPTESTQLFPLRKIILSAGQLNDIGIFVDVKPEAYLLAQYWEGAASRLK